MSFTITYRPLFSVDILHKYHLDRGMSQFQDMSDEDRDKRLVQYDLSSFLEIVPTSETMQSLQGYGMVFKVSNTGFTVWCKVSEENNSVPFTGLDDDLQLTFLLKLKDPRFFNYTELPLDTSQRLFLFTNSKPGTLPTLPLMSPAGSFSVVDQSNALPADVAGEYLKKLSTNEKDGLWGMVTVGVRGDTADTGLLNVSNEIPVPYRKFEIYLGNRKTFWRYIFRKEMTALAGDDVEQENGNPHELITKSSKPLTQAGFVTIKLNSTELPNPDAGTVVPGTSINEFYSEIYM